MKKVRGAQQVFIEQHLLTWVPDYCNRVQTEAREPFYKALAELAAELINEDYQRLQFFSSA